MALLSIGEILDLGNSANMSSYIPYSALDYDPTGAISGISGSAIAGGVESSVVSSIVSSMVSSKADKSALENCCSSMSSVVSSIQNNVSSISSFVSGLTGDYLEKSASSMFAPSGNYMSASESSSYYPMTGNPSGFLTSVDLSDYATTAYVDSSVSGKMDATASGYLQPSGDYAYNSSLSSYLYASASSNFQPSGNYQTAGDYAYNSAVSAKLDASASSQFALSGDYAYNSSLTSYIPFSSVSGESNLITAINGSAISGQGGGAVTGDYVENSALDTATARSATGSVLPLVTGVSSISGQPLVPTYLANPTYQYGGQSTFVYMPASSIWTTADVATGVFSPLQYATGACLAMDAGDFKAFYKGNEWFVANTLYGYARGEAHGQRGIRVIVEHTGGALAALSARGISSNVTLNSTALGTAQMAVGYSQAYVQVQRGTFNNRSRFNSAKLDTDFLKFYAGMTTGYLDPEDTASGTSYLPAETEYIYISSIPYWNGKQDALTFGYDANDKISSIDGSAIAGGAGGGIDSATCSAIASAYAESAVSSYVPYSALESAGGVITAISGTAIGGGGTGVEYSGVAPIVVDNVVHKVSAESVDLAFDNSMTSVLTDSQLIVGVNTAFTVPVQVVSSTALATGAGIVYVVQ